MTQDPHPLVQVAIDVLDPGEAVDLARAAVAAGADWLEIGKPFIEFNGLRGCRRLIDAAPEAYWLLDLMVMAGGPRYVAAAADLGVRNLTVTQLAPERTVAEVARLGAEQGLDVTVDLFNVADVGPAAVRAVEAGASHVMVHVGVDEKRFGLGQGALDRLREVVSLVDVPVSYAVYDLAEAHDAIAAGAAIVVQGEPLISAPEAASLLHEYVGSVHALPFAQRHEGIQNR